MNDGREGAEDEGLAEMRDALSGLAGEVANAALFAAAGNVAPGADIETGGGTRFSGGKPGGWWFMPLGGLVLVSPVAEAGAEKYAPLDWRVGQSFSTLWNSMFRHLLKAQVRGVHARDAETGHLHVAHAAWNLLALLEFMAEGRDDLDDISKWIGVTTGVDPDEHAARMKALEERVLDKIREGRPGPEQNGRET